MVTNLGTGGSALDAQSGSTSGADTNDPLHLAHDGTNYVYLPGISGNYLSVPDSAALDITGDIDIRVRVALDDWTPSSPATLLGKWVGYLLRVETDGTLNLFWSTNGADSPSLSSSVPTGIADGSVKWARATLDVDNGASGHTARFYVSDDGADWTQVGSDRVGAGVTSIFASSAEVSVGAYSAGASAPAAGKFYRAIVKSGIDGTTVLDVDTSVITSGAATSFTATTGQTVTINRSTSGRKAVAVTAPVWLFGTDDYLEVADHADLDFAAGDSFTVLAVVRQWATQSGSKPVVTKEAAIGGANAGWGITPYDGTHYMTINDASVYLYDDGGAITAGAVQPLWGVRSVAADTLAAGIGSLSSPVTDTTTGTLSNSQPLRVAVTDGFYADMELLAVAVWRRALTDAEVALVTSFYASRWP